MFIDTITVQLTLSRQHYFFFFSFFALFCLKCFFFQAANVHAQQTGQLAPGLDTLHLETREYMPLSLHDSLSQQEYKQFYSRMKARFSEKPLQNRIFNLLFDAPAANQRSVNVALPHLLAAQAFSNHPIGRIRMKRLKPFGYNIADTAAQPKHWYQRTGNDLHFLTRHRTIRKNLLFESGEPLDVDKLADTERLLRRQPFIRDARVLLETRTDSDTVDIVVITEDVFPYSVGGSWGGFSNFSAYAENYNMFGIGHELLLEGIYNSDQTPRFGYQLGYGIPNIQGTFIDTEIRYHNTERENSVRLSAQRPFYSPNARWAGGITYAIADWTQTDLRLIDRERDSLYDYRESEVDSWLARAIPLPATQQEEYRRNLVVSGRYVQTNYANRPQVASDLNPFFEDRQFWLAGVSLNAQGFRRDRYIFGFGRTEDVPEGYQLGLLGGVEAAPEKSRPYLGTTVAYGKYLPRFGYLRSELNVGSFFEDGNTSRSQLEVSSYFFSPLISWKNYRIRQFVRLAFFSGYHRHPYEYLTIRDNQIRGLYTDEVRGTRRINLSLETLAFTPFYILGFQFAVFAFSDLAHLSDSRKAFSDGSFFQSYGAGLNVRNDNLVFQTFQLRFSVYPNLPTDNSAFGLSLKAVPSFRLSGFNQGRPEITPFR